jgi:hypothetical protein
MCRPPVPGSPSNQSNLCWVKPDSITTRLHRPTAYASSLSSPVPMAAHHASPLMHATLEPEMDEHLATEAGRIGGRVPFGRQHAQRLRAKKVMTEVGAVTVRVPRDGLGTFRPQLLPSYVRRTGAGRHSDLTDREGPDRPLRLLRDSRPVPNPRRPAGTHSWAV